MRVVAFIVVSPTFELQFLRLARANPLFPGLHRERSFGRR